MTNLERRRLTLVVNIFNRLPTDSQRWLLRRLNADFERPHP